jgi:hypothetical protein
MDFGKVIGRAWQITWRWKILWVLGFLASLASSGGGGSPGNAAFSGSGEEFGFGPWTTAEFQEFLAPLVGTIILVICVLFIIAIALWVVSVIARGGLIAGVQQVEDEGRTTFRSAWVAGRRKFWTLFGLGILAALPMLVVIFVLAILFAAGIAAGVGLMDVEQWLGISAIIFSTIILLCFICCGLFVIGIILEQIRVYGERAAILEDLGWIEAFKRGWQVLKDNLGATIIFWILFAVLGLGLFIILSVIMLLVFVPIMIGVALIEPQTWMIVPGVGIGLLVAGIFFLIRSVITTFISSSWTLAYRDMTGVSRDELEVVNSE